MPNELRGVNHVGVPVRNLDETIAWYKDIFDIEPRFRLTGSGAEIEAVVDVEGAVMDCAFFVIGNTGIEFIEYLEPKGRDFELRNCDVGAMHICFEVDDLQAVYERLKAHGVDFSTPPRDTADGPLEGLAFVYFRDLQGLQFELFQIPAESPVRA